MTRPLDLSGLDQFASAGIAVYDALHRADGFRDLVAGVLARGEDLMRLAALAYLPNSELPLPAAGQAQPGMIAAYVQAQQAYSDLKHSLYRLIEAGAQAGDFAAALAALQALVTVDPAYRDVTRLRPGLELRQAIATEVAAGHIGRSLARLDRRSKDIVSEDEADHLRENILGSARKAEVAARQQPDLVLTLARGVTMAFRPIPAGEFQMGDQKQWVETGVFQIGKFLVTTAQFTAFVRDANYSCDNRALRDLAQFGNHPVVFVSLQDTEAFCEWASGVTGRQIRLPTEQEWEKAARGVDGRTYPWGEAAPQLKLGNFYKPDSLKLGASTTAVGDYSPVADSPYGCADMIGNVWEWTSSVDDHYRLQVLRGGSDFNFGQAVSCANRQQSGAEQRYNFCGFRCAL